MTPDGLFGRVMELANLPAYRRALAPIEPLANEAILEIGFGTGKLLELLSDTPGVRLAGVDPTPAMVKRAKSRRRLTALRDRLDLRESADAPLPWPDRSFDAVVAVHSFQFWPDPHDTLSEIRRVLKPKSRLVLVLRDHSRGAPDWLPNPISRAADEPGGAVSALQQAGFVATLEGRAGSSVCVLALTSADASTR